jgi:hypothetical protein
LKKYIFFELGFANQIRITHVFKEQNLNTTHYFEMIKENTDAAALQLRLARNLRVGKEGGDLLNKI